MDDSPEGSKPTYFAYDREALAVQAALLRKFGEIQKAIVAKYLRPENSQRFRHGGGWSNPGDSNSSDVQWQTHSAETSTRFDDVVSNDLSAMEGVFSDFGEAMERQFAQMIYATVSEAAEKVGNVVDARAEKSLADAFIASIEKIEFMADKYGEVSLPELHVSPETGARMMAALEAAPQEFRDRLEALKAQKTEQALAREAERKGKFVRYGLPRCAS